MGITLRSWSPDGSTILFRKDEAGKSHTYQVAAHVEGERLPDAKPLVTGMASELGGRVSPDGRWIAFVSDETVKLEVYVAAYGAGGTVGMPVMVSVGGGRWPRWSRDGKRLFYASRQSRVMSVALQTQPTLSASAPVPRWNLEQLRINDL